MALNSMTGFGRVGVVLEGVDYTLELRTLNSRYRDLKVKLPIKDGELEFALRKLLSRSFHRGRLDFTVRHQRRDPVGEGVAELKALARVVGEDAPDLVSLLLFRIERALAGEAGGALLSQAGREASLLATMGKLLGQVRELTQGEGERLRSRLERRLEQLLTREVDRLSLEREVALLVEKADIHEEITRLQGHLQRFQGLLGATRPVGRTMEFLCQELLREVNTMGSKTHNLEVTNRIVTMKNEIEKLRELSANVE